MSMEPVAFVWDGQAMIPLDRFRKLCQKQFRPGTEYALVPWRGRSEESHRHYFACIRTGWNNLPEEWSQEFPTAEHLRKWCLVQEGYADHTQVPCETPTVLAKLILMIRKMDPYAVMKRRGEVLDVWVAQSQDHASMGHEAFQESKDKVLGRIANMCGISVGELTRNAKEPA